MPKYPREDTCAKCGAHVGWIISEAGEMFALGLCDDCLPDEEEEDTDE